MSGKFMSIKRIVVPMMTLIILCSQLAGCAQMPSGDMLDMINKGESIVLELPAPSYEINIKGQQQAKTDWVQLDQLQTHNKGFRQDFDSLFNINTISQNNINGKNGCLYVDNVNDRNGNTTLENAVRNKVFVNKYWNNETVKSGLAALVEQAYTDIDKNSEYAIAGALNAYYNLLPDALNPDSFNATQSLSRGQFYELVFKSEEGVKIIDVDNAFVGAIGGATENSKFAQEVDEYGFLSVTNKSLDANSYKGSISRAEAVYMMVNKHFPNELAKVTGKEAAFKDTKNAGDLALKLGFKEKKDGEIISKDRWQSYTLAYMVQHPDKGLQEELYRAMVVAKQLKLIDGTESRWDEPISKAEGIQLVVNTYLAENSLHGYLSDVEYGNMNTSKNGVASGNAYEVKGVDDEGFKYGKDWTEVPSAIVPSDPSKDLGNSVTLGEVKKYIDIQKKHLEGTGLSENEMNEQLEQIAKEFGTSLDEVNRLPDTKKPAQAVQQPTQKDVKPSPEVNKPAPEIPKNNSGNTSGNSGSTGGSYEDLPDWMKEAGLGGSANEEITVPDLKGVENPFK